MCTDIPSQLIITHIGVGKDNREDKVGGKCNIGVEHRNPSVPGLDASEAGGAREPSARAARKLRYSSMLSNATSAHPASVRRRSRSPGPSAGIPLAIRGSHRLGIIKMGRSTFTLFGSSIWFSQHWSAFSHASGMLLSIRRVRLAAESPGLGYVRRTCKRSNASNY